MGELTMELIKATAQIAGVLMAVALLRAICQVAREYAAKMRNERWRQTMLDIVEAVEQQAGQLEGRQKREKALGEAEARGLPADDVLLEAAVHRMKRGNNGG